MFMNNFTKSDRSYWWSITNLTCCSSVKSLQSKSITAFMLLMFLAFSSASFAQVPGSDPTGGGEEIGPVNGCMHEVPARKPVSELMAPGYLDGFFDACIASGEDFVIHEVPAQQGVDGEWGVATGFSKGSTHCSWTYYYVYSVKCAGEVTPFTVKYNGGDATAPWVPRHLKSAYNALIADKKDLNVCYNDRPIAPTAQQIASYYDDNCDHVKVSGELVKKTTRVRNDDCGWIEIHTYTVADYCPANTFEFSITYSGADIEAPAFVGKPDELLPDITVNCDEIPRMVPLSYTDNCAASGRVLPVEDRSNLGEACAGGYILRTYTIEDDCGNKDVYQYRIDVRPAPKAYFEYQGPIDVPCVNRNNFESFIPKLNVYNGMSGDCEIAGIVTGVYDPAETDCGTFDVTYTFEDNCGRVTTKIVQVTIVDDEDPGITYASRDLTVECDGAGNLEAYANWVATLGGATAQDNCTPTELLEWSHNAPELPNTNGCGMTGSTTVIFIVKDLCGNQSKTYATFTIEDTQAPILTPAINQTVVCDGAGNVDQFEAWLLNVGGATAKDDCSDVTWTDDFDAKIDKDFDIRDYLKGGCTDLPEDYTGYIDVTFTATDACGHSVSTVGRFTIEDSIAPYISEAQDKTVECDGNGNQAEYNAWIASNGGASLTQPDACSAVTWSHKVLNTLGNACDMYYIVEFTASDLCGNESSTIAEFHIVDTLNPMIGLEAQDYVYECNEEVVNDPERGGQATWQQAFEAWLANNGGAQAMDICDDELTWTHNAYDAKNKWTPLCGNTGFIIVTFVATDDCGHNSATTAEFRIVDTKAPYLAHLEDVRLEFDDKCEADTSPSNTGWPRSFDDCAGVTVTYADVTDKQDCVTTITRTWTSTDECNNSTQNVQVIRIYDVTAPEYTGNVQQFNMSNVNACEAPAPPAEQDIADQFSDACGYPVATLIDTIVSADDKCGWAVQFVYDIKDNCGNPYGEVKVSYWGSDQNAPQPTKGDVASGVKGINDCMDNAIAMYPGADKYKELDKFTDDCSEWKELSITKSDLIDQTNYNAPGNQNGCVWQFAYKFTVTDACGNDYVYYETYSGEDKLAPRLIDPASLSDLDVSFDNACKPSEDQVEAWAEQKKAEITLLFMECGPNPGDGVLVTNTLISPIFGNDCDWQVSLEYNVYDICGNYATPVKVTYSGGDTEAPQWNVQGGAEGTYGTTPIVQIGQGNGTPCPQDIVPYLSVGDVLNPAGFYNYIIQEYPNGGGRVRINLGIDATDNCTANQDLRMVVNKVDLQKGDCLTTLAYTFELLDNCDNSGGEITCVWTFIDNTDPTASNPAPTKVECEDDVPAVDPAVVIDEADNCQTPTVEYVQGADVVNDTYQNTLKTTTITRTYRVSDGCGNSIDVYHDIIIEDRTSPTVTCPSNVDFGVVADTPTSFVTSVPFNDNCDGDGTTTDYKDEDYHVHEGDAAIVFTIECNDGNSGTVTFAAYASQQNGGYLDYVDTSGAGYTITRENAPGPFYYWVFRRPGGQELARKLVFYLIPGVPCSANWNEAPGICNIETNSCGVEHEITHYTKLRTFTATDSSGNTATCIAYYTWTIESDLFPPAPNNEVQGEDLALNFRAYPVPFKDKVTIKYDFEFDSRVTVQVFDTKGLLVLTKEMDHKAGNISEIPLAINNSSDQLYYVKVTTDKGTITKKIVSSKIPR